MHPQGEKSMEKNLNVVSSDFSAMVLSLNKVSSIIDTRIFDKRLSTLLASQGKAVVVTVQSQACLGRKETVNGWATTKEVWHSEDNKSYFEINMSAEQMNRPWTEIVTTLAHEMLHIINNLEGLKDTSRQGRYHNKVWAQSAKKYGFNVPEADSSIGYSAITLDEFKSQGLINETNKYASDMIYRDAFSIKNINKAKKVTYKYVCPVCGAKVSSSSGTLNLICGDCNAPLELELGK